MWGFWFIETSLPPRRDYEITDDRLPNLGLRNVAAPIRPHDPKPSGYG